MLHRFVFFFLLVFSLAFSIACGDMPEAIPAPHAIATVQPYGDGGKTFLFATNRYTDQVYRVDLSNFDVREVKVGNKPRNITASPDGRQVAVASEKDKSITLIDTLSLHARRVHTGREPRDVRYSPDGQWIAVANYKNESVSLIGSQSGEHYVVWVGGGPASVAFDETSRIVAVACFYEESIKVIGVASKQIVAQWNMYEIPGLDVFSEPQAVAFGPAGTPAGRTLFVGMRTDSYVTSDAYADSIATIPLWVADDELEIGHARGIRAGPNPRGFSFDHDGGRVIVINKSLTEGDESGYDVDTLSVLIRDTGETEPPPISGPGKAPTFPVEVGRPSLADYEPPPDQLERIRGKPRSALLESAWRELSRLVMERNPTAVAMHPEKDRIAVACRNGDTVIVVDLDSLQMSMFATEERPYALSFDPTGQYVIVAHETPLMPLSIIDTYDGDVRVLFDSLSMRDWVE
ncbi:MAG: YncE family protein [Candidatus Lernaella stagnicola]|nr:YncE family protein [Candidatus Lernaella stagnicola]